MACAPPQPYGPDFLPAKGSPTFDPSNWLLTNPEALNKAQETQGQSLRKAIEHFSEDLRKAETARSDARRC